MKKPEYVEMWAAKENRRIYVYKYDQKPIWDKRYCSFIPDDDDSVNFNNGYFSGNDIAQFGAMKEGQICKVGLIIWEPEDEDGTD